VQANFGDDYYYFGTIQTWDASVAHVDAGYQGDYTVDKHAVRQYRSGKQCSSIQPGTESFLHSHPMDPPSSCSASSVCRPTFSLSLVYNADTHAKAPELEAELRRQSDAYQCRLGKHVQQGNANVTSVEDALCRQFGTSSEGNWYREGLTTEHQLEQLTTWQDDIADRLPQLQYKWEQYNYCDSPSSIWTNGKYTLEEEWFNNKAKDLYPMHPWYVAAAAVSFCCLMVWILLSPHRGESAKRLDQTCT
jgi:hypothetical protein